jgi:uncharacterized membrane protein (UPF0136 family)
MRDVQNSPPNSDLIVANINLAAAILSFLAVLIGIAYAVATKLRKEDRQKAISIAFRVATIALSIVGVLAYLIFGAERLGLAFYVFASILISVDYVRGTVPAERVETLLLVLTWVATSSLLIMHQLLRISNLIGRIIGVLERLVH